MHVEIAITAGPAKGQQFVFDKPDRFVFGRSADARVSLPNDPYVSRQHFLLEISPPECKVTDLNSKNGLFVNGIRYGGRKPAGKGVKQAPQDVREVFLKNDDEIVVGDTRLKVTIKGTSDTQRPTTDGIYSQLPSSDQSDAAAALLNKLLKEAVSKKTEAGIPEIQGYHIEKMLDRGGMGMVYRATALNTGQPVAIKVLYPDMAADPENVRAFQREIEVTRQLKHPHIVQLFDHGETNGTFYFVLEFVDGMNLYEFFRSRGGCVSLPEAAPIILGSLDGMAYAHQAEITMKIHGGTPTTFTGIVHRDIKPQNILLANRGTQWIPKISDFGISKSFEAAGLTNITKPGDVLGTPMYWPREQITHYKYLSPVTDVFSLAAVFYEMLTGKWVREGFEELFEKCKQQKRVATIADYMQVIIANPTIPIRRRDPNIPESVANVIDRALREAEIPYDETKMRTMLAELRYPDAAGFREALRDAFEQAEISEQALQPEPELVTPVTPSTPSTPATPTERPSWKPSGRAVVQAQQPSQAEIAEQVAKTPKPSMDESIFYSIMRPASKREVALLVYDLEESSEYIREVGDTHFANVIGMLYKRVKTHTSASQMIFMKSTGDGFLAVFQTIQSALSMALNFLENPVRQDLHGRMALHWGDVKTGPDGDVLGVEVHRVFRVEGVREHDRVDVPDQSFSLPDADRILITKEALEYLNLSDQLRFKYVGAFRLKGFKETCPLWILQK